MNITLKLFKEKLKGKKILITGGLGMIGSNLAHKLVANGANVTIVDAMIKPFGANLFNLNGIRNKVFLNFADIRDIEAMKIFNEIESEVSGKIVKITAQDGSPIEYGQTLMLVEPS